MEDEGFGHVRPHFCSENWYRSELLAFIYRIFRGQRSYLVESLLIREETEGWAMAKRH